MTRKVVPWFLGVAALSVTVFVATKYLKSAEAQTNGTAAERPGKVTGTAPTNGITVKGVVDTPDGIYRVDAPAIAAALTVSEVLVKEGQEVKVDDPLLKFDTAPFKEKVEQAKAALAAAESMKKVAKAAVDDKVNKIKLQDIAVAVAKLEDNSTKGVYKRAYDANEKFLNAWRDPKTQQPLSDDEKANQRRENIDLEKLRSLTLLSEQKVKKEEIDLQRLIDSPVVEELTQASAGVDRASALLRDAQAMLDACTVKSKVAGVVEQVFANSGMTFSSATRTSAILIVPSGSRVVRAEVEAEFAHKISDRVGQTVTIYDDHNFNITYSGTVKRVSTALLPKRGTADLFQVGPANRILEVVIEVSDPAPKGKPPLLPGLPVRVGFTK